MSLAMPLPLATGPMLSAKADPPGEMLTLRGGEICLALFFVLLNKLLAPGLFHQVLCELNDLHDGRWMSAFRRGRT